MTVTYIDANDIGPSVRFDFADHGDGLVILPGVTLASTTTTPINTYFLLNDVTVLGTLSGLAAISLNAGSSFTLGAGGTYLSFTQSSASTALYFGGGRGDARIDGTLRATEAIGVVTNGSYNTVTVTGSVAGSSGVFLGLGGTVGDSLVNSGMITANAFDDVVATTRYNNAVFTEGQDTAISNLAGGVISAISSEGAGVRVGLGGDGSRVFNAGTIISALWYGVEFSTLGAFESARLHNEGLVQGRQGSFNGGVYVDFVTNRGVMAGHVALNGGDDRFDGRGGRVEGEIFGGAGADLVDLRGVSLAGAVHGDEGNDTLRGGEADDTIYGGTQNDTLQGGGGDDLLQGGFNSDLLAGGDGDDTLSGGDDFDDMSGGAGDDDIRGEEGLVIARGGAGNDVLSVTVNATSWFVLGDGGEGDDTFQGGQARDVILGGDGDDVVFADDGDDSVDGGAGNDLIDLFSGADTALGGAGDDTLLGFDGADLLSGGTGNDSLAGSNDVDTLNGDAGDDVLDGGAGNDLLAGGAGADTLLGGANGDSMDGGTGDDVLNGGSGGDSLQGGAGNDVLLGDTGSDTLAGGLGADVFQFLLASHSAVGPGADRIEDFLRGVDLVDLSAINGPVLVFRGTGAFSGVGAASVRYDVVAGNAVVRIDANGDATVDSEIVLAGVSNLNGSDFLL